MEPLIIQLNGKQRSVEVAHSPATLDTLITALDLKADRIAVELNGEIVPRTSWPAASVRSGDKLEIVHFVGGGLTCNQASQQQLPPVSIVRPSA